MRFDKLTVCIVAVTNIAATPAIYAMEMGRVHARSAPQIQLQAVMILPCVLYACMPERDSMVDTVWDQQSDADAALQLICFCVGHLSGLVRADTALTGADAAIATAKTGKFPASSDVCVTLSVLERCMALVR